eukprot:15478925-Alexandrium_andersonii.AAC.1
MPGTQLSKQASKPPSSSHASFVGLLAHSNDNMWGPICRPSIGSELSHTESNTASKTSSHTWATGSVPHHLIFSVGSPAVNRFAHKSVAIIEKTGCERFNKVDVNTAAAVLECAIRPIETATAFIGFLCK